MVNKYQPLFLKYRPQSIGEVVGQNQVTTTLTNAIKYSRISHAYLFTGPRGTGKTSSARILAKSLNCEKGPTAEPCQVCTSCLEIKQGISPSVFEIDAASNNSVDDARLLIERAPLSACGGRFKLYIIDECHMLTKEAFNALLKTIEEPPANVIFVLATTEEHKVPPTIVSRCQKLIFRLIDEQSLTKHLEQIAEQESIALDPQAIATIARRASGGLRDALSLLDQVSLLGLDGQTISTNEVLLLTGALPEDILIALSKHILNKQGLETLSILKELLTQGREAHLVAAELAKHMLNIAKAVHTNSDKDKSELNAYQAALLELGEIVGQSELIQIIEELDRLEVSCRRSTQPVMNLEIGLLSLCHRLDILQLQSLQSRIEKLESDMLAKSHIDTGRAVKESNLNKETSIAFREDKQVKAPATDIGIQTSTPSVQRENKSAIASENKSPPAPIPKAQVVLDESPKENSANNINSADLDTLWQNILIQLQRRHLPTFSLVSTHAFPVSLTGEALTIGVFVENFQKMLENKIEHIKAAVTECQPNPRLKINVKLVNNNDTNPKPDQSTKAVEDGEAVDYGQENKSRSSTSAAHVVPRPSKDEITSRTAVKEAYRLFEGPGSRFIAPTA